MTVTELAGDLLATLGGRSMTMASAESCTGGMVAAAITDIPGASAVFRGGVVVYSNDAKVRLLGVQAQTIASFGAVSAQTAQEMASGAARTIGADCAVAITGIAGPDGGSADKPVGTVWFGFAVRGATTVECVHFDGDRRRIREAATAWALTRLCVLVR